MQISPYPDINDTLDLLLSSSQAVLDTQFVGMMLYGSLASGDFDPQRSDIDFIVVTADELTPETVQALDAMHKGIWASGLKWAAKLEGCYTPRGALRSYNPSGSSRPCVNAGAFFLAPEESDWIIHRHILREQGVVLAGPAPDTLIDPVQPEDLRRAVREFLREWWQPMLDDLVRLRSDDYQAYAILTMCRSLHTLAHGSVASKPAAARWAQQMLGEPWVPLIRQAMAWQPGQYLDRIDDTLALIRTVLKRSELA